MSQILTDLAGPIGLQSIIDSTGRYPSISIRISPLDKSKPVITLHQFLDYTFDSSITVPCDTFSFSFAAPQDMNPYDEYFQEGDIVRLYGNDHLLATGLIDAIDSETEADFGERIVIRGRDLMAQLEDHDAISIDSAPIYGNLVTPNSVCTRLRQNTRIPGHRLQGAPLRPYLFATEPGESKLAALTRYLEPLNCLAWIDPDGTLVLGRPNMSQDKSGSFVLDRKNRISNVIAMKSVSAAATIPNVIIPVWVGQENVQTRVAKNQAYRNSAPGPSRLYRLGHLLPKCVVMSNPQGNSAQDLSEVNRLTVASGNLLQAQAKREVARQNFREKLVQVTRPGHYNDDGTPYQKDTVYDIFYDRARIEERMYCYQIQYTLSPEKGQRTNLFFTRLGTIVGDVVAP